MMLPILSVRHLKHVYHLTFYGNFSSLDFFHKALSDAGNFGMIVKKKSQRIQVDLPVSVARPYLHTR